MPDIIDLQDEFFHALGGALERWQWIEGSAYKLYQSFMDGANRRLISVTFHHIKSFDSRILLLDRCAYFALDNEILKSEWTELKKRLTDSNDLRNRIVHFSYAENYKDGVTAPTLNPSHFNAIYAIKDKWGNPKSKIYVEELIAARRDFEKLARELDDFSKEVLRISEYTLQTAAARSESSSSDKGK